MKKVVLARFLLCVVVLIGASTPGLRAGTALASEVSEEAPRAIQTISYSGQEFLGPFNAARDEARIVLVFSPTCGHCLQGASEVREMLEELPDAKLQVFVLWSPILANDSRFAAENAVAYLPDKRVHHFWDLWAFGINHYTKKLNYPEGKIAWDIFVLYAPGTDWTLPGPDPDPAYWMQDHNLDIGPKYEKNQLKSELVKLLK